MKTATNAVLVVLALAAAALGIAAQLGKLPPQLTMVPPLAFWIAAGVFALLFVIVNLPLRARRAMVFLVVFVILAGLVGGLSYFQFVYKPTMIKSMLAAAFAPKPTAVAVEAAKVERWPPELKAIGTVRAYQGITIAPQVGGIVTGIHFESGDDVAAGASLVDLDDSVEQADLKSGLAQLKNASLALDRAKTLIAGGNTPQSTVDAAVAARDSAAAAVEKTRAVIAQKAIRAPFAGRLGLRNVDLGQYVAVGANLVTLQRLDPIDVDFPAPEEALSKLAVGQEVELQVDSLPSQSFKGRIKAIDARVSAESRNVTARAEFPNPSDSLLPGMFANVTVTTGASADVLTLPRTAIVYSLYGDNVFVVQPAPPPKEGAVAAAPSKVAAVAAAPPKDAKPQPPALIVERRFVRLGAARGERVAVLEGVSAGERVVIAGQIKLQANSPIVIDEGGALPPPDQTPKP